MSETLMARWPDFLELTKPRVVALMLITALIGMCMAVPGFGNKPGDGFAYMAGYVDSIKYKDSDEFIAMSEAAGAAGTDKGLTFWTGFHFPQHICRHRIRNQRIGPRPRHAI